MGYKFNPLTGNFNTTTSGTSVGGASDLSFDDNAKVKLGAGNDLQIYHDGTHSRLNSATGIFNIQSDDFRVTNAANNLTAFKVYPDGATDLRYNGSVKLQTTSSGADISGDLVIDGAAGGTLTLGGSSAHTSKLVIASNAGNTNGNLLVEGGDGGDFFTITSAGNVRFEDSKKAIFGAGSDLEIYHNGSNTFITNSTGYLLVSSSGDSILRATSNAYIQPANGEVGVAVMANGAVELKYDNSKKLETWSGGVTVTGGVYSNVTSGTSFKAEDNGKFIAGGGNDLQIYHDGTHSYIENATGGLYIKVGNGEFLNRGGTEVLAKFIENGNVQLYYDNSKKFETTTSGAKFTGSLEGTGHVYLPDSGKLVQGDAQDLQIYHGGTHSYVYEAGGGNLVLRTAQGTYSSVVLQAGEENSVACYKNGGVDLFYDSVKKFNTESTGAQFYGNLRADDNCELRLGNSGDLQLYHDGSNSYIVDTGTGMLRIASNEFRVNNSSNNEIMIHAQENGEVQLRHDNSVRLYTWSSGVKLEGDIRFDNNTWTGEASNGKIQTHNGHMYLQNAGSNWIFRLSNGTEPANINSSGSYSGSDERRKKDITTITGAVDTIKQLVGRSFTWKEDNKKSFGVIAQEVETVLPELVTTQTVVPGETNSDPFKMVNYAALTGHLIEAIKELSTKVAALEAA